MPTLTRTITTLLLCACVICVSAQKIDHATVKDKHEAAFNALDTNTDNLLTKWEFEHPDFHVKVLNLSWPWTRTYININGSVSVGRDVRLRPEEGAGGEGGGGFLFSVPSRFLLTHTLLPFSFLHVQGRIPENVLNVIQEGHIDDSWTKGTVPRGEAFELLDLDADKSTFASFCVENFKFSCSHSTPHKYSHVGVELTRDEFNQTVEDFKVLVLDMTSPWARANISITAKPTP